MQLQFMNLVTFYWNFWDFHSWIHAWIPPQFKSLWTYRHSD